MNIIVIYISEAHAKDEWPLSSEDNTNQHRTIKERIQAASRINTSFPIYVDSMDENSFENVYCGWPERAFIIQKQEIKYVSYHKVDGYDDWHEEVEEKVQKLIAMSTD